MRESDCRCREVDGKLAGNREMIIFANILCRVVTLTGNVLHIFICVDTIE